MGGGCVLSNAVHMYSACLIPFLTVRFTLWIIKGNAIMSFTGTAKYLMGEKNLLGGEFQWNARLQQSSEHSSRSDVSSAMVT